MDDNFNVSNYSDKELFDILDLTDPSDRVLEAKIISMIKRYEDANSAQGKQFLKFFEDMYDHFFEDPDEDQDEDQDETR